jgi:L-cysteine:1D-myo-inositol 2-amino-2-deoxy-alpha-D-glucopyranoside ligase
MTYDLLQRRLEDLGHKVEMVRNITDVDEPIYRRAQQLDIPYTELASQEIESFHSTLKTLNFRSLFAEPMASDYIDEMAEAVSKLLEEKIAYKVGRDIYFDTAKYPDFHNFSGFSERLLKGLFKLRGGDPGRVGKRQPLDFLLWKSVDDQSDPARWDSDMGHGRPGWHIECSIMSSATLGVPFDIHGGGTDLIFPHHSAEIVQSQALGFPQLANNWLHVSPLLSDGEKMSKSLGNLVFANDLLGDYEPSVIRLALMQYHHRIGGEWQPELLHDAQELLNGVRRVSTKTDKLNATNLISKIRSSLDDDINTLEVVDALKEFVRSKPGPQSTSTETLQIITKALTLIGIE